MVDTNPTTNATTTLPVTSTAQPDDLNTPGLTNPHTETTATTGSVTVPQPLSSTPESPPSNIPTDDVPVLPQRPRESPVDPRVVALRAMFPDYDDLILQSVLESVGGNQDRAIDTLLGMSDPDYRSEQLPSDLGPVSQTDLDEQLARRLMIEEQDAQQAAWQAQEAQRAQHHPRPQVNQQYSGHDHNSNVPSGGDTMGEFQQQFNKIAETGKKTFGTIFSKVKAKIQEFDQPRAGQGSDLQNQPAWGGSGAYDPYHGQQTSQGQQQPYSTHQPSHQSPQQQPAYYDPNAYTQHSASPSPPITNSSTRPASGLRGYDAMPDTPAQPGSLSSPVSTPVPPTTATNTASTSPPTEVLRPPQTGSGMGQTGAPIDGGKLGLLPKRPVSLLRSQSPPATTGSNSSQQLQRSASEDDSDGLEYAENPFEERKK